MSDTDICLYGSVGISWWGEDFFTAKMVHEQIKGRSGPITVRINSGGGIASEGLAIYTLLVDHPDTVNVIVDGVAYSSASLIAMAGDTITMRLGASMLIHDPAQPYTEGRGTEADHLKLAEELGVTSNAYADIYARRAGIAREAARAIMQAETLLDGAGAVEAGFATGTDALVQAAAAARFDYRMYAHAPEALRAASSSLGRVPGREAILAMSAGRPRMQKETTMSATPEQVAEVAPAVTNPAVDPAADPGAPDAADVPSAPAPTMMMAAGRADVEAERQRAVRIQNAVAAARLPVAVATHHIEKGTALETALDDITRQWKEQGDMDTPMPGRATAHVRVDARDKFKQGAELALMMKVGLKGERNEFSSLSLAELARESLVMAGERATYSDRREMVGRAFTMAGGMTTSDFGNVLANVMGKAALQGWDEAEETFPLWTRKGVLTDFKATRRVGAGLFDSLPQIIEGAEYTLGTVGDRGEPITLATYGKMLRISRQAIINDDLSILGMLPRRMGRAARRTIGDLVYAILTGNPTMSDSVALFNSAHNNLAGTGAAPSVATLSAADAAMRVQKESATGPALNITPKYMIVPAALRLTASQLLNSAFDPTTNKGHAANPVAGMAELITDGRLDASSTTAWYLAADPNAFDTIEVAYLDGNDAPYIEQQTAWTSDGVEMKVRIDAAAAPLDFRTLYKNPGA